MPVPYACPTLFTSVLCGAGNDPTGVAARRQAAWLAGAEGLVEVVPRRELTDAGAAALAERCNGYDLLVVGAEANAHALFAATPIPVLLARSCPLDRDVTDEILVAVADHAGAARAAEVAALLAVRRRGSVSIVAVPGRMHELARAIAATQRIVCCSAHTSARVLSEPARPEVEISRAAARIGASLLVVGIGDDAWSTVEAGDIARHAACSLLAVPDPVAARSAADSSRSHRAGAQRLRDRSPYRSPDRSRRPAGPARRA